MTRVLGALDQLLGIHALRVDLRLHVEGVAAPGLRKGREEAVAEVLLGAHQGTNVAGVVAEGIVLLAVTAAVDQDDEQDHGEDGEDDRHAAAHHDRLRVRPVGTSGSPTAAAGPPPTAPCWPSRGRSPSAFRKGQEKLSWSLLLPCKLRELAGKSITRGAAAAKDPPSAAQSALHRGSHERRLAAPERGE